MPLQATSGAASYDAFGGGVAVVPNYIEDVFSTWLYTGNDTSQTITNGIDLAGKGGLVWSKQRTGTQVHVLVDTVRGNNKRLQSNSTAAEDTTSSLMSFNSDGYGIPNSYGILNSSGQNYASWTFREQPKFFDVVTYTGNGSAPRDIAHNLGSSPGCVIIKRTSGAGDWWVWHRATPNANANLYLNYTDAADSGANPMISAVSSTTFTLATNQSATMNASGATYVAYLFAHNAGGFGLSGTDNVISCGSFTTSSIGLATVDLGYEPQWILYKGSNGVTNWQLVDNMRGFVVGAANSGTSFLNANTSAAEGTNPPVGITNTGFNFDGAANITYIYIAIRRGPMRTPTTGTSVFEPVTRTGTGANTTVTTSVSPVDMAWAFNRNGTLGQSTVDFDRLRGALNVLYTGASSGEFSAPNTLTGFDVQNGYRLGSDADGYGINFSGAPFVNYNFRRAPGFFDEVCYTGTGAGGSPNNVSHNLGAVPELIIVKRRTFSGNWAVYSSATGNSNYLLLNTTDATTSSSTVWNNTTPTSSVFTVGNNGLGNSSGEGYVAYLFASAPGVSKVFSYTGNGSSQTINCGFTGSARFVMIKRTDSTGDWYVWDTARGIVANNDPHLSLNSTAAEVTTNDTIDTDSTGFVVNQVSATNVNVSSATYIGLAIA